MDLKTLRRLQKLPMEVKVKLTKIILNHYIKENKDNGVYLSYSGGKDSSVMRRIALEIDANIPSVFCNTTNEQSEIMDYIKKQKNITTLMPKMGFRKILKKYGFPMVSKLACRKVYDLKNPTEKNKKVRITWNDKDSLFRLANKDRFLVEEDFNVTAKCCDILKKEPFRRYELETGRLPVSGIIADESSQRQDAIIKGGVISEGKMCRPMAFWLEKDIWKYSLMNNFRFSENYYDRKVDGVFVSADKRSGCELCLMGFRYDKNNLFEQDRLEKAKILNPKRFERLMDTENNGVTFRDAIKTVYKKII